MILINEFLPNPLGVDKGNEWIEIVNISENEIDISNWEIQIAGITFKRVFKFPSESKILPNQYILICEEFVQNCNYYTSLLAIQNGGKETDGVRILNEKGQVIDTVLYDTTNSNNLLNDFEYIEKDENIVEMPAEGCSIARRNFSDTNFSIKDFFITCTPTPGKKNIEINSIIISEVGFDFIEFYSSNIPDDLESWYVKNNNEKIFLKNDFQNNFFFLQTQNPLNNITLHSPDNTLVDSFSKEWFSKTFSYCRLNSKIDEEFSFCENTKGEINKVKDWKTFNLLEFIQLNKKDFYTIQPCVMYQYENLYILSDQTAAIGIECEECEIEKCFLAEITPDSKLQIIQQTEKRKIEIETLSKENYLNLFHKLVFVKGVFKNSDENYSYFETDIGILQTKKEKYFKDYEYTLKGIFKKDINLELEYSILVKQESVGMTQTLEDTGDPLIYLFFFLLTPFLLLKIFAKLSTIKFKGTIV